MANTFNTFTASVAAYVSFFILLTVLMIGSVTASAQTIGLGTFDTDQNALVTIDNVDKNTAEAMRIKGLPTQDELPTDILVVTDEYVRSFPMADFVAAANSNDENTVVTALEIEINNRLVLTDSDNNEFSVDLTPYLSLGAADQTLTEDRVINANGNSLKIQGLGARLGIGEVIEGELPEELVVHGEVRFGRFGKYYNDETVIADFGNGTQDSPHSAMTIFEDGTIHVTGNMMAASDRRLKENFADWNQGIETVMNLDIVTFDWKAGRGPSGQQVGFIAQNVQQALPQAVATMNDEIGTLTVDNRPLIAASINAIQELVELNEKMADRIEALEARLAEIETAQ